MNETQKDLFESVGDLPEWLHIDWMCQNRCPGRIIDDCTLPSVQYSLPSFLKLSTFSFNANMVCFRVLSPITVVVLVVLTTITKM